MPRKKRQIRQDLYRLGFILDPKRGKGDHQIFIHPGLSYHIVVAGADGDDAKPYDEKNVRQAKRDLGV